MSQSTTPSRDLPDWAHPGVAELISQSSSDFHYLQNARGHLIYVSPSVHTLLGYSPEEYATNCRDIPDWNSPRTLEALSTSDKNRDAQAGVSLPSYLIDVRHRDGTRRTHEVFEQWRLGPDGQRYLFGLASDVTEREIVESKFSRVQELTKIVNYFGEVTPQGSRTLYLGPTFEAVYDMPRELMMADPQSYAINVHPDDLPAIKKEFDLIGSGKGPDRWHVRYRVLFRDGTTHWLSNRGVIERGNDGQLRRWIGLAEDITEQVHAEEEKKRREALLVQSQKLEAVGHLAAGMTHNFSNLLLAIQGYIDLARRTLEPNHPAIEALSKIEETSEQARGLTRSLLTLTHQRPTQPEVFDLSDSLENALRLLRRTLPTTVRMHRHIEPGVRLLGDPSQIDQVLLNIALNARDAMPNGGSLTIDLRRDNQHALLTLTDTGHGMDEAALAHAFEPFYTTKPPESGTGLGLSITHGIVTDHGGTIELAAPPEGGTRVRITLPLHTEPKPSCGAAPRAAAAPEPAPATANGTPGLAVVVFPTGLVQRIVSSTLIERGYTVQLAASLEQSVELVHTRAVSAVVLDSDLVPPEEFGCGASGLLRSLIEATGVRRVVLLCDEPEQCDSLEPGPRGVLLRKPFMQADLIAALNGENPPTTPPPPSASPKPCTKPAAPPTTTPAPKSCS